MIYSFSKFNLNTHSKELFFDKQVLSITSQHYDLLLHFVCNPGKVFSKDELIDSVWKGRYVTENTIDQSISKLRKILNSACENIYIKTAYGKGFIFLPEVELIDSNVVENKKKPASLKVLAIFLIMAFMGVFLYKYFNPQIGLQPKPLLLIMSPVDESPDNWLNQSTVAIIDQVFGYADVSNLKHYKNKPEHQNREQYIENQWKISPNLKVVNTHVSQSNNVYTVKLELINKQQHKRSQSFNNQNLGLAIKSASIWLAQEVKSTSNLDRIESLIPQDSYIVELYMRALSSFEKGEIDKAGHFLQICIDEKPEFYLARLEMAKVYSAQGNQDKSLALLETLSKTKIYPQIEIEIATIRGDIYDTLGKYDQAKELYLSILDKFDDRFIPLLNEIRYNLSYTYATLNEYDKALFQLKTLESEIDQSGNLELLAHVFQKKASILQKLGHINKAKKSAEKSLKLFSKLQDVLGEAKVYITLARISTHQSKYKESIQYLERALSINKSLNYKLGVGATLNEMIYVLMVQGHFSKALNLNKGMQKIALDIDYNAMLQISKQYDMDINRLKKQWKKSKLFLKEHLQLAQASKSKSALLKNKLLAMDLYLDQNITDNVESLIMDVQTHIDESGEIRLQPRINKHLARYYFLINNSDQAVALLISSKELALNTEDGETLIEINNLLAEYYLKAKEPRKALAILEDSLEHDPLAYPYLLIKSKANKALGNTLKALDYANECKNLSNEWWTLEDDIYLARLENNI